MDFTQIIGNELKNQAMGQILSKVGGNNKTANALIQKALPTILGGLEKNSSSETGLASLSKALEKHTGTTKIDAEDGKNIFSHIFWDKKDAELDTIAASTGATKEQSNEVMGILSSLVMEKLGDQKAAGLDGSGIEKILSGTSTGSSQMLGMMLDQDGDGDFDKNDAMKFGMGWIKNKFLGKK